MDERLLNLIRAYQQTVAQSVAMLEAVGISRPASNTEWATTDFPQRGRMPGGFAFYPHGYGCAVHGPGWVVDFDFGSAGEIDGFDSWRLRSFARKRLADYGFESEKEIDLAFQRAKENNDFRFSGYLLYYLREGHVDVSG